MKALKIIIPGNIFILIAFNLVFFNTYPQMKEMDIKKLKSLGRESLINIAAEQIKQKHPEFNSANFDRIKVMASNKRVYVTFNMSVKFVPRRSAFYYGVYYDITDRLKSLAPISNPPNYKDRKNPIFFVKDDKIEETIDQLLDIINSDNNIEPVPGKNLSEEEEMIIRDKGKFYEIEVVSEYYEAFCKIKIKTGKVYDIISNPLISDYGEIDDDEIFEEIK